MFDEYTKLINNKNILLAWQKFSSNKTNKKDVVAYWRNLEENIFNLHTELEKGCYRHGGYQKFIICDPKKRLIHTAQVKDRIVHQLVFSYLQPIFEKRFIFDSYASRIGKGAHRAIKRLRKFCTKTAKGKNVNCWILKCDINKYFASIDHKILFALIESKVHNKKILNLVKIVIESYADIRGGGLPLGNLTSQLFANIYLNEFDYFVKHKIKLKYYIRYNDDFAIMHYDKKYLEAQIALIKTFLQKKLHLVLPNSKTTFRKFSWGIDFLGYIVLPKGFLLRTRTKKRVLRLIKNKIEQYQTGMVSYNNLAQTTNSYLGILKHAFGFKSRQLILNSLTQLNE